MNSERSRLTALYGALLILAGVLLTSLVYVLLRNSLPATISVTVAHAAVPANRLDSTRVPTAAPTARQDGTARSLVPIPSASPSAVLGAMTTRDLSTAVGKAALNRALTMSGLALGVYAVASVGLAWWMAGRVLHPVGVITARARRLSGTNLHERLRLRAPPGELKELADTFDGMLGRIERLVNAQQRFAANAAHQLRTPLAVQRAAAEIGLAGDPAPETVARIRAKLIENAEESERLIEGLLLLAASDEGVGQREPVELDDVVSQVVTALAPQAQLTKIEVQVESVPATVEGDPVLLGQLVHNLVSNALIHNHESGTVRVRVTAHEVEVVNTGPVVPADSVSHLFEPFHGARDRQYSPGQGAGLGLSIVASITAAHGAMITAVANPGGGLAIRVVFPD